MGIGTFGSFTQARLAIYAAQTGLTVTGNNISNVNTAGYTRQRLNQVSLYTAGSDRYYAEGDIRTGQGALVKSISQIRSPYLDIRFRELSANVGYMNAQQEGLSAIKQVLDEVGKGDASKEEEGFGVLGLNIEKLFSALEDIVDQTGQQEYDENVKQVASNLIDQLHAYAGRLEQVRKDTDFDLHEDLDQVNDYLNTIRSLNEEIRKSEIHGDPALELRDERNRQIDELSGLIDIDVTYTEEELAAGLKVEKLTIRLGNANPDGGVGTDESLLVDGIYNAQLSFKTPDLNPSYGFLYLDDTDPANPVPTNDEAFKANPNPDAGKKYLKADGTATDDIREAKMLETDGEDGNYLVTVSVLKNKVGEIHRTTEKDQMVKVTDPAEITRIAALLKDGKNSEEVENTPQEGDTSITIYRRSPARDADGHVIEGQYNYYKQEYRQIISKPVALDDNDLGGEVQAERELLTEEGIFTDKDVLKNIDENAGGKRGIKFYQNSLDVLARQFAEMFNDANQGFRVDDKGNYIQEAKNAEGKTIGKPIVVATKADGTELYLNKDTPLEKMEPEAQAAIKAAVGITDQEMADNKISGKDVINAYLKGQKYETDPNDATAKKFLPENKEDWEANAVGIFDGAVLFSNDNNSDDTTNITASNISISKTWFTTPSLVRSFECPPGDTEPASGQSDNFRHMGYLLNDQKWDFYPNTLENTQNASDEVMFNGTIFEMWNKIGSTLGQDQSYTETMLDTYYENALSVDTERDSISSVDFNDEAMNLMMYAKSYNAACRLMTTLDSVLDKLINNTGMTT